MVVTTRLENQRHASVIRSSGSTFLWLITAAFVPAAAILLALLQSGLNHREVFNDPSDTLHFNPFMGVISTLGLFGWAAAAGVALLTHSVIRDRVTGPLRWFFLASGVFTLVMLTDDAFLLHEEVLPNGLGIRERYIKLGYLVVAALYGLSFLRVLLRHNVVLVAAAAGCFVGSFVFDNPAVLKALGFWETDFILYVVEDGLKFFGISFWLAYLTKAASDTLRGVNQ